MCWGLATGLAIASLRKKRSHHYERSDRITTKEAIASLRKKRSHHHERSDPITTKEAIPSLRKKRSHKPKKRSHKPKRDRISNTKAIASPIQNFPSGLSN
ncbi:hypothetical protein [Moorena producens]|uniref:hypothetical protein n=1 Tax=Moorena producens TaxID=1155739 RepID=UPI003C70C0AC